MVTLTDAEIVRALATRPEPFNHQIGTGDEQSVITVTDMAKQAPPRIAYARAEVERAAPDAPDEAHNLACITLTAYLIDAPPSAVGNAWERSGCTYILRSWLIRRAVAFTEATA